MVDTSSIWGEVRGGGAGSDQSFSIEVIGIMLLVDRVK